MQHKTDTVEETKTSEFNALAQKTWLESFQHIPSDQKDYYLDIQNTTRFLVSKAYKSSPALEMWKSWVIWRTTTKPHHITPQDIPNELATRKAVWFGQDVHNNPCLVVKICRVNVKADPAEVIKFGLYMLEKGLSLADKSGSGKVVVLIDKKGLSRKMVSSAMTNVMKELLTIIQRYYPERLSKLYILNANWVFKVLYTILTPFIDSKTRSKICFVSRKEELKKEFTEENIPREYEGLGEVDEMKAEEPAVVEEEEEEEISEESTVEEIADKVKDLNSNKGHFMESKLTFTKIQ